MLRFCANITLLFREKPLLERFSAAHDAGFAAVEILSPENASIAELTDAVDSSGVHVALVNAPMGDYIAGGPGLSAVPGRQQAFKEAIGQARGMAEVLGCKCVHIGPSRVPQGEDWQACYDTYLENASFAAQFLAQSDIGMTIEALNSVDTPDIFISRADQVLKVIGEINQPNVSYQFDAYHASIMEEDYLSVLEANIAQIGHIQFADMPGRGEPGSGGLDFSTLFKLIERLPYKGWVGSEYQPSGTTQASLAWFSNYLAVSNE